jgi:protein-S-isoprenylcysteine O-methyltransferase Ste14
MYLFLIPLLLGFALGGASAFTATYSRWWGKRGGALASSILRNFLGIPLWLIGFIIAWLQHAPLFFNPDMVTKTLSWLVIFAGSALASWGHMVLGWRTHFPSMQDTLVRHGIYAHVRHPIYAGMFLMFFGLILLNPTLPVAVASTVAMAFFIIMARLEEIDLMQRMPDYHEYKRKVPGFIPRVRGRRD